jgi:flagellar biosynthetic protein FliQ
MDTIAVVDVLRDAVGVVIKLGGPMLVLSMLVGVIVAVFQAVTQIHEQTISFVLKLIVVVAVLLIGGGWMLDTLQDYTLELFDIIAA